MERQKPHNLIPDSAAMNLPGAEAGHDSGSDLQELLEAYEKKVLLDALHKNLGHRANTATMLGIDRKTLYTKMKKYGIG